MDATEQTYASIDLLTPLVEGTRPDQLGNATPCDEWTVRDLMNHFVGGGHMFAASLRGDELDFSADPGDLLGDDHVAAYQAAIADFRSALSGLDSMERPAVLPIGTVPAEVALRIAAGDLLVHGWDLAQSTGQAFTPPDAIVNEVEGFYRMAITPELRVPGAFGAEVEVSASAPPLERLVAFAGRQP